MGSIWFEELDLWMFVDIGIRNGWAYRSCGMARWKFS